MNPSLYRYTFPAGVKPHDVEETLLLALIAAEGLHGEALVRLDVAHAFDAHTGTVVIDGASDVGRDLNKLFVNFVHRQFGPGAFRVERLPGSAPMSPTPD